MASLNQSWQNNPSPRSKFNSKVSKYEPNTATPSHSHKPSHMSPWGQVSAQAECRLTGVRAFYNTHTHKYNSSQIILYSATNKA